MTKVSFSCLTSPIHPIFTHNDMKHAKMQDVKKVPNLASDFVCSGHIKTKVNGFSHSPTRDLEGRKKKKHQQNRNHLTKAIPTLASVSMVYDIKGNIIYGCRKTCRYMHLNSQIYPNTCCSAQTEEAFILSAKS